MSLSELLDLVFRWVHMIAGIMWIGNSMLFNWLDRNLEKSKDLSRLSQGKIYMVHSGAFYDVEKKLLEPGDLPKHLHWFKYQNLTTWLSGLALMVVVYYLHGASFLIDPRVAELSPLVGITISVSALLVGWIVYDGLWSSYGDRHPGVATVLSIAMLFGSIYGFAQVFGGRGAFIQTGVLIGTLMTGNVWMSIVPSQHALVAATKSGGDQDPKLSIRAKQRSIHNNYLTFPLLFIMISNHFPATYQHHLNWLILISVMVGGAGIRHFMNIRYLGGGLVRPPGAVLAPAAGMAGIAIAGILLISHIKVESKIADYPVSYAKAADIMAKRCTPCHSAAPTDDQFKVAPVNVRFDKPDEIQLMSPRIKARAVDSDQMPFNNKTAMTAQERAELGRWIVDGAKLQ
ncbi:MAG: urate hydroxylase PuuD [Deltaproteobacteria bacterium]|nr:urate hydroxylase PuuD [Deltaproteobacteria bacterium]